MSNDISELRGILFDTLRELRDPDKKLDIERATAINNLAQTVVASAKVEVDYARVTGNGSSGFLEGKATAPAIPSPTGVAQQLIQANVRRHECK